MSENTEGIMDQEDRNDIESAQGKAEQERKAREEQEKMRKTAEMAVQIASKGKMPLALPLKDGERTITELEYDFLKLTGMEMADAMDDYNDGKGNQFEISKKQALSLFAAAAGKCQSNGLFAKEIRERLGARDAISAMRIATLFFVASVRAASFLTMKE